ncbi:MAG: hypothetical protein KJ600_02515 [Nanoarchaeota archaeon]|nr:hypothetical protein [Nanoarchaeota archaeon]
MRTAYSDPLTSLGLSKGKREQILLDCYQIWIQPKMNSANFPELTTEDILKKAANKKWHEQYDTKNKNSNQRNRNKFKQLFEKEYGPRPRSLISQEGWFLITATNEKDVSNIHYSFGFEDKPDYFWVEIALNSVESVEQVISMNDNEINELFKLTKKKPSRMILKLTEKRKINWAGSTDHTPLFDKKMNELTTQDLEIVRMKANEINNRKDPLDKPFVGLCVVEYVKKEELAENFKEMEDIFEFLKKIVPRKQRYKSVREIIGKLEKEETIIKNSLPTLRKETILWKNLGKFDLQEEKEKEILRLEHRLEEITQSIKNERLIINSLTEDMKKNE